MSHFCLPFPFMPVHSQLIRQSLNCSPGLPFSLLPSSLLFARPLPLWFKPLFSLTQNRLCDQRNVSEGPDAYWTSSQPLSNSSHDCSEHFQEGFHWECLSSSKWCVISLLTILGFLWCHSIGTQQRSSQHRACATWKHGRGESTLLGQ